MASGEAKTTYEHKTTYEQWMEQEGLPIVEGYGVEDLAELPRAPWPRLDGSGVFVQLRGTVEGGRGLYVAEIPSGGALNPEKHVYEEIIYVLRGHGSTEVWQQGLAKRTFEWGPGSLFAPPINTWHRLINGSREPALFFAVTSAPEMMDTFHNLDFIFNCPYVFADRFGGEEDYFQPKDTRYRKGLQNIWETNFIADVMTARLDDKPWKASGGKTTQFEISGNTMVGHIAEWPVGRYHKGHYHGPGAVILGLKSTGYVLLWHKDVGTQPYQNGREHAVTKLNWKFASIYSPTDGLFHQHFNTGKEPARHLAIRYGSRLFPMTSRRLTLEDSMLINIKQGGSLIEYEDEDPEIRRRYEAALKQEGVECQMPPVNG